jgi:hypothetical protein
MKKRYKYTEWYGTIYRTHRGLHEYWNDEKWQKSASQQRSVGETDITPAQARKLCGPKAVPK